MNAELKNPHECWNIVYDIQGFGFKNSHKITVRKNRMKAKMMKYDYDLMQTIWGSPEWVILN